MICGNINTHFNFFKLIECNVLNNVFRAYAI